MKRKGGQQQRIKAARSEEESSAAGITQQSALVTFLLTLFTWEEFSPQRCQHIAALALEDLEKHHTNKHIVSDLKALASIGSNGAYPSKMHQDLMQRTKNISKVLQPYLVNAKFKSPVGVQHGDGVPVVGIGKAWTKLLNVFSWFSLVGTGTTRSKLFYTHSCWDKIHFVVFLLALAWPMA